MGIQMYDSPTCIDRYTVVIDSGYGFLEFFAMSGNPSHPQGVNMYCGSSLDGYFKGPHLGALLEEIPGCIRSAIELRASPE